MADPRSPASQRDSREVLKQALLKIKELQSKVDAAERQRLESIAVVGAGCRLPGGVVDLESLWTLVRDGVDAIGEVPVDRWDATRFYDPTPGSPGKMRTRWGGFIGAVDQFDAAFFGIAPREAAHMDPQQRLWLEVAWEALESAGQTTEHLAGSRSGVWAGVCASDYMRMALSVSDQVDAYDAAGGAESIVANRLSYLLDLQGPSVSVDTACSSALVAVHLACQSLRRGECDLAVAGGVSMILTPEISISLSSAGMLAPDGRCKTFDARADGYVRGEGCGIVVLKRLSDALAAGDRIRAVIRGSAVNQDGRSNGLTAPNVAAQKTVLREALAAARVAPEHVALIEAHGTGTMLGDPVEVDALTAVYGRPRTAGARCALSAIKANIGHLEGAAGIAGLLKVIAALEHRAIPPQVHFRTLNPNITLTDTPFVIATELMPWPEDPEQRYASVSSFGFGGTNAHVILERAPERHAQPSGRAPALLLPISAKHPQALCALAEQYALVVADDNVRDVCFCASVRRSHHPYRAAIAGQTAAEVRAGLRDLARHEPAPRDSADASRGSSPPIAFVFSGQGSQWPGMARDLLDSAPVFREALERCDLVVRERLSWSVIDVLQSDASNALERTDVAQPTIAAVQIALSEQWRAWGIAPAAVIGHSVGEIAAACVSGVLSVNEAMRLACERGKAMHPEQGRGDMAAMAVSPRDADDLVAQHEALSVAAYNSPRSVVISGPNDALASTMTVLQQRGLRCKALDVGYAFHSPQMSEASTALRAAVGSVDARPGDVPFVSTVTGTVVPGGSLTQDYWSHQVIAPVRFAEAVASVAKAGGWVFLEIGGHPVLQAAIEQCVDAAERPSIVLGSLRRSRPGHLALVEALARLYAAGANVNWRVVQTNSGAVVDLPRYPWQRSRHWLEPRRAAVAAPMASQHRWLGRRVTSPALRKLVWETRLSVRTVPFLTDHRIDGRVVVPAVLFVQMARAAANEAGGAFTRVVQDLVVREPLVLPESGERVVQTVVSDDASGTLEIQIFSRDGDAESEASWRLHAGARMADGMMTSAATSLAEAQQRCLERVDLDAFFLATTAVGFSFGPAFRGLVTLSRADGAALGRVEMPPALAAESGSGLHPALLDAALQVVVAAVGAVDGLFVPFGIDALTLTDQPHQQFWSHARLRGDRAASAPTVIADVDLLTDEGVRFGVVEGLRLKKVSGETLGARDSEPARAPRFEIAWRPSMPPPSATTLQGDWLICDGGGEDAARLAALLEARGAHAEIAHNAEDACGKLALQAWRAVIYLAGTAARGDRASVAERCAAVTQVALQLAARRNVTAPLWIATNGIHAAAPSTIAWSGWALWGLGRVIALEQPEISVGLIDVDPSDDQRAMRLLDEIATPDGEDQIAYRGSERFVARLTAADGRQGPAWTPRASGTYLITGGFGGLGLLLAAWLVRRGARQLALVGHHPPSSRARAVIAECEQLGARVTTFEADVAHRDQLDNVFKQIAIDGPPVRGVFHLAGALADAMLPRQDEERFRAAFAPKIEGAWHLHDLTQAMSLDCFVLFSSAVAILGAAGQANYAAANASLDGLARYRRARGLPALSINWGPWAEAGMAARDRERWRTRGVEPLTTAEALGHLETALGQDRVQAVVLSVRWAEFFDRTAGRRPPLLSELVAPQSDDLVSRLGDSAPAERFELLQRHVRQVTRMVLGLPPGAELDDQQGFSQLGMDSLMALELRNTLQASIGRSLPSTVAFDFPTVARLSDHLSAVLSIETSATPDSLAELIGAVQTLSADDLAALNGDG